VRRSPAASCSPSSSSALSADSPQNESLTGAVTQVSEKLAVLVREEIELAKAEVTTKVSSLARGGGAVLVGAVFGVFALVFVLETIAWGLDAIFVNGAGNIWIGFAVVMVVLLAVAGGAFLFAWRKLRVGAPKPTMAIDEAKRIRATVRPGDGA
jgi:hypothetical protein